MKRPAKLFKPAQWGFPIPGNGYRGAGPSGGGPGSRLPGKTADSRHNMIPRFALRSLVFITVLGCVLWPAILNSHYIFFYDTTGYLRGAIQAFHVAGIDSEWSAIYANAAGAPDPQAPGADSQAEAAKGRSDGFVSAARSIYYGTMLYAGELLGGLWIGLLLQVFAAGLAVYLTLTAIFGTARNELPIILGVLGVFTPLSFFASYLMPDIFAGITILACASLLVFFDRLQWGTRVLWLALLSASLAFHTSHIAIAVLLVAFGALIVRMAAGKVPWTGAGLISAAIAIGLLSQAVFYRTVEAVYGHSPLQPPFLMARVIADGPGYDYLRATCPDNGFRVCEFLPVLPLSSDEFLWSRDPEAGVVGPADPETRRALAREQLAFVAQVLRYDFPGQFLASLRGFMDQLSRFGIEEFRYSPSLKQMVIDNLPARYHAEFRNSLLYKDGFPFAATGILLYCSFVASVIILIWGLWQLALRVRAPSMAASDSGAISRKILLFCFVVLCGVTLNAAVTGVLSTPHDRYQARVIWLVTLLALLVFLFLWKQRRAMPVLNRTRQA